MMNDRRRRTGASRRALAGVVFKAAATRSGTAGAVPDVVLTSQYDGMGDRLSLSATIGNTADFENKYQYDNLARLDQVYQENQTGGDAVAPKSIYYALDGIGDVTGTYRSTVLGAGAVTNGPAYSLLSYNNTTGQLKSIDQMSNGSSLDNLAYSYDGVGRVATFSSVDGQATYGYDPMSQLTSATYSTGPTQPANETYSYDTNGNRTAANGTNTTLGPGNHVASDGTYNFVYDWDGNLVSQTQISGAQSNDHQVSYVWDSANRLVEVQDFNNSGALTGQVGYAYDVFDHLIERVDEVVGSATSTTHYVWDDTLPLPPGEGWGEGGGNQIDGGIVLAFDGNQNLTNRYLNGPNTSAYDQYYTTQAEEDVTSPSQQGSVTWDLLDNQDSVRDQVNNSGTLVNHIVYNTTGVVAYEQNSSVSRLLGWQGGIVDGATGEEDFGNRWYNAVDAVWNNPDPIGFLGGSMNLTESRANDPTNTTDPTGQYNSSGHFWTTFIVARAAGFNADEAFLMAYNSQLPDQVKDLNARTEWERSWNPTSDWIWRVNIYLYLHSLHGGNAAAVKCRRHVLSKLIAENSSPTGWEAGFLIHALSDAFAHTFVDHNGHLRAFGYSEGHGLESTVVKLHLGWAFRVSGDPDVIATDPAKYREYVATLYNALVKGNGGRKADPALLQKLVDKSGDLPPNEADAAKQLMLMAREHAGYKRAYIPTDDFNTILGYKKPSREEMDKWFAKVRKACNDAAAEQ